LAGTVAVSVCPRVTSLERSQDHSQSNAVRYEVFGEIDVLRVEEVERPVETYRHE